MIITNNIFLSMHIHTQKKKKKILQSLTKQRKWGGWGELARVCLQKNILRHYFSIKKKTKGNEMFFDTKSLALKVMHQRVLKVK